MPSAKDEINDLPPTLIIEIQSDSEDGTSEVAKLLTETPTAAASNVRKDRLTTKLIPKLRKSKKRRRNRIHIQCRARRLGRWLVCAMLMPLLLFLFYLPVYTNVPNRQIPLTDWTYNTSRNVADYVLPLENTNLIAPHNMCTDKIFLIIIVCSNLHNFVQRQTIRETWGNTTEFDYSTFTKLHAHLEGRFLKPTKQRLHYYNTYIGDPSKQPINKAMVHIVFLLGRSKYEDLLGNETLTRLHNEADQYNDIIQENFIDSYNNLTIKSVLALKYMTKHCLNSSAYFMKCDDDTFVNVPNLLQFLLGGTIPLYNETVAFHDQLTYQVMSKRNRLNATKDLLLGHLFCTARPVNDISSKWYMPYYMYPRDLYPKYLSGAGYLMSIDVVERLYEIALNTSLIYLEDVYITGLCAEAAHLARRPEPLFSYTRSRHWCAFKGIIIQHEMKDDSMVEAWRFVSNYSIQCPPPSTFFKQMRLRKHNC